MGTVYSNSTCPRPLTAVGVGLRRVWKRPNSGLPFDAVFTANPRVGKCRHSLPPPVISPIQIGYTFFCSFCLEQTQSPLKRFAMQSQECKICKLVLFLFQEW